ncbi:hypothetical protein GCM10023340_30560 [Nocardioides marinquilinus]|uniref:Uncharacterized protein n=1 Tax=Nocardioides marinquilinus TaxID=1210400 RepID=A0ABP9PV89_9ACTN
MNDRITDLLDEVADDTGRPVGFSTADVVRGGQARRRRRFAAAGTLAAVVTAGVVATLVVTGPGEAGERPGGFATDPTPSVAPSGDPTAASSGSPASPAPTSTPTEPLGGQDALVDGRCRALAEPPLGEWRLDAQATVGGGSTATFVSPQGDRWRQCDLGGEATVPGVSPARPLDRAAPSLDNAPYESAVGSATLCPKDGPAGCTRRLFTAALPLREGVASVEVETPSGRVVEPDPGTGTYVVRFVEDTDDPMPVLTATLRDADGTVLLRYDMNGLMR